MGEVAEWSLIGGGGECRVPQSVVFLSTGGAATIRLRHDDAAPCGDVLGAATEMPRQAIITVI